MFFVSLVIFKGIYIIEELKILKLESLKEYFGENIYMIDEKIFVID